MELSKSLGDVENFFGGKAVEAQIKDPQRVKKKHKQIVQTATELFSQKGFHATSMRDISAKSGINLSNLYQYISSKDEILYLFFLEAHNLRAELYKDLAEETDENPILQLKKYLKIVLETMISIRRNELTLLTECRHLRPNLLKEVLSIESKAIYCLERLVVRGIEQNYFHVKDAFLTANMIEYMLFFYVLSGWNFRKRYPNTHFVALMTDTIFNILGVSEEDRKV